MIAVELVGVRLEMPSNTPIVLLQETDGERRMLPIFIGQAEATAIALHLEGVDTPRPMTHDLAKDLITILGATLEQVVVTDLRDKTFFAEMHFRVGEREQIVSCRPSDAIAIAVRSESPIYVAADVIDSAGFAPEPEDEPAEDEVLDEFRDFIDNVNPEDFGG